MFYPCSHYHAVAVRVSSDSRPLQDPNTDFDSFESINNVHSCDPISETTAYIAAEFGSDKFTDDTLQFIFGDIDDTLNDKPQYFNDLLCFSTKYAFFLRVYNDVVRKNKIVFAQL